MKKISSFTTLLLLALAVPFARAEPAPGSIPIRGRISPPVAPDTRVELLPVSIGAAEAVRLLSGEPESPLATVRPAADGTFTLTAPEPGFYRVAVRAEGFLDLQNTLYQLLAETDLPPVRLRPAETLEIAVIGSDGRPAAGIAVTGISSDGFFDGWEASTHRTVSGEDGLLRLPWGKEKPLMLVVTSPAFFGQIAPGGAGWTTLRLKERPLAEMRVQEANGHPLSGAVLWGGPFPLAVTGPDGRLRMASDAPPEVVLRVETADGREAPLSFSPGESHRTVTPVPREVRRGRVLDAVTRTPLPGALVWQVHPRETRVSWTRTGPDGAFRLPAIPGSQVLAVATGHLTASAPESPPEGPLSLILEPAASLAGRVVDAADKPVAGAVVEAMPAAFSRMNMERVRTGPDGSFRLRHLGADEGYRLTVKAKGFLPWVLEVAPAPGEEREEKPPLRIVLDGGAAVTGRLIDPAGRPVAGAALSLAALAEGAMEAQTDGDPLRATSDAAGRFRLEPAAPGRFLLELIHPELALASRPTVEVAGPRQVDLGDVRLGPAAAIEGLVTDGRGAPLPGAQISLGFTGPGAPREPTLSGPDGRFRLGGLAPGGRFNLFVYLQGHLPHQAPGVEAPSLEPLRISLRPARSLTGRVVDSGGRPIPGVSLSVVETQELRMVGGSQGGSSSRGVGQTDSEGRFIARELEPGTFHLAFEADGYRPEVLRGVTISEEEDPAPIEVVLESGTALSGRVTDSRGRPASGLRIFVLPLEQDPLLPASFWGETDAEGGYRIAGLAAGQYRIAVHDQSQMRRLLERTAALGSGDQRLDLEIPAGHQVSGRVVDGQGGPVRGARISLVTGGGQVVQGVSGPDGAFRFAGVPDGTWRLAASARGHAPESTEVGLAGGDVNGLVLRLSPAATITGRLLGLTELERNQVEIMAWPEPERGGVVTSQVKGSADGGGGYRIPDVGPGSWTVEASLPSGRTGRGVVQVNAPGGEAVLDLEIPRGLTLSGRILLDGRPFTNAGITLATIENGWPTNSRVGVTRHDGTFELQGVKPGRVTLAVMAQGIGHARALDVASDQEVTIEILTGLVNGHVLSADGQPAEGALVTLHGEDASLTFSFQSFQTRSDERGAFELPRVAAGSYRVTVSHPGSAPMEQRIVVTPGGTTRVEAVLK